VFSNFISFKGAFFLLVMDLGQVEIEKELLGSAISGTTRKSRFVECKTIQGKTFFFKTLTISL
jgi:hypothetical protein